MKNITKKYVHVFMAVLLVLSVFVPFLKTGNTVKAAELPANKYTMTTVPTINNNKLVDNAKYGEGKFYISPTYTFPNDVVLQNGDYMVYQVPNEFKIEQDSTTDLRAADGTVIAKLTTNKAANTATITVTNQEYFANLPEDKTITALFTVVWADSVKLDTPYKITIPGAGVYNLTRTVPDEDPTGFTKWGVQDSSDPNYVNWRIRINRYAKQLTNVNIADTIPEGQVLASDITGYYFTEWNKAETRPPLAKTDVTITDPNHFSIRPNGGTLDNKGLYVMYKTRLTAPVDNATKKAFNNATATTDQGNFDIPGFAPLTTTEGIGAGGKSDEVVFEVTKKLEGKALESDAFTFQLIAPDGTVTFTPDKQFVGKPDPVTVKRIDKNGTPVTATYSPEFTKVTPIGKDASSENIKGLVQTGTPTFQGGDPRVPIDETVAPTFEDGSTEKVIPGQGTYTIAPDGTVTFTPEADFVGKGTGVTIVRKDKNGTSVTASYRPTVVDPSTGQDTTSTGAKGQTQVATPAFEGHIDSTVPPTFEDGSTTLIVPGEGSYTIDKDGKITFTPEPDFVGTAKGVVVKRLDIYGNVVTAQYTPTVIGQTRVEDVTSDGLKGQTQTGKPIFEGDVDLTVAPTFEDGSTEKVVPGEGTYTISPDGVVTFVPEPNFVGTAKGVVVIRKDRNGQTISASYTPRVTEIPVVPNRPSTPEQPKVPVIPAEPAVAVQTPEAEERVEPVYVDPKDEKAVLPRTGSQTSDQTASGLLAAIASLTFFGLANRKKKSEED